MRIPPEVLKRILPRLPEPGSVPARAPDSGGSGARPLMPGRLRAPDLPSLAPRLTLRAGQVLLGHIVRIARGGAILDVDGTRVRASIRTPMRLSAGDQLWLQAEAAPRHELPVLRVFGTVERTPPLEGRRSSAPNWHAVQSLLRASRLPITPTSRAIVEQMVRLGLPYFPETADELVRVADAAAAHPVIAREAAARAALLAYDRGLPLTEQVVRSVALVLTGPALVDLVEALALDVRRYLSASGATPPREDNRSTVGLRHANAGAPIPAAQARGQLGRDGTLSHLLKQLDALARFASSAASAAPAEAPATTLDQLFQQLGMSYEVRLATLATRSSMQPAGVGGDGAPVPAAGDGLSDLKPSLLSLLGHEGVPDGIRARASALLDHITGRQLLMRPQYGEPLTSVIIPLPVGDGGRQQWLTVWGRFRHDESKRGGSASPELDLQNCRIVLDLQLPKLGRTVVNVHIVNRAMQVEVMTAYLEVEDLLRPQRKELAKALGEYGFGLIGLEAGPLPERAVSSDARVNESPSETIQSIAVSPRTGGVNLKI